MAGFDWLETLLEIILAFSDEVQQADETGEVDFSTLRKIVDKYRPGQPKRRLAMPKAAANAKKAAEAKKAKERKQAEEKTVASSKEEQTEVDQPNKKTPAPKKERGIGDRADDFAEAVAAFEQELDALSLPPEKAVPPQELKAKNLQKHRHKKTQLKRENLRQGVLMQAILKRPWS